MLLDVSIFCTIIIEILNLFRVFILVNENDVVVK